MRYENLATAELDSMLDSRELRETRIGEQDFFTPVLSPLPHDLTLTFFSLSVTEPQLSIPRETKAIHFYQTQMQGIIKNQTE